MFFPSSPTPRYRSVSHHLKIFLCSCFQLFCFLLAWNPNWPQLSERPGLSVQNRHDPLTAFVRDLPGARSQDTVMWALFLQLGIKGGYAAGFRTHHSNSYSLANWILCLAHSILLNVWFVQGHQARSFVLLPVWQSCTLQVFGMCVPH